MILNVCLELNGYSADNFKGNNDQPVAHCTLMDLPRLKGLRRGLATKPHQSSRNNTPQSSSRVETERLPLPRFHIMTKPVTPKNEEEHHLTSNQQLDESLYIGFETKSEWKNKVKVVQSRAPGWLNRFGEDIDESIIAPPKMTKTDLRNKRIIDSGWTNVCIDKVIIPEPLPVVTVESMPNYNPTTEFCVKYEDAVQRAKAIPRPQTTGGRIQSSSSKIIPTATAAAADGMKFITEVPETQQTSRPPSAAHRRIDSAIIASHKKVLNHFCYVCLQLVPLGPSLVNCRKCPVVVHLHCLENKEKFLKTPSDISASALTKISTTTSASNFTPPPPSHTSQSSGSGHNSAAIPAKSARAGTKSGHGSSSSSTSTTPGGSKSVTFSAHAEGEKTDHSHTKGGGGARSKSASPSKPVVPKLSVGGHDNNADGSGSNSNNNSVTSSTIKSGDLTIILPAATNKQHFAPHSTCSTVLLTDEITAHSLEWICPFCHSDVAFYNTYNHNKHNNQLIRMVQLSNCIKLQSYIRMLPVRIRFNTLKRGMMMLQRCYRLKMFNLQEEVEKANMRYPFRIRLHEIKMFTRINHSAAILAQESAEKTAASSAMGASSYNLSNFVGTFVNGFNIPFGINPNRDYQAEIEKMFASIHKPHFLGEITSMGYDKLFYGHHSADGHHGAAHGTSPTNAAAAAASKADASSVPSAKATSSTVGEVVNAAEKATGSGEARKPEHLTRVHKLKKTETPQFFASSTCSMFTENSNLTVPSVESVKQTVEEFNHILMHNHIEAPSYAKTYKSITAFERDTLFLTVSVHELPTVNPKEADHPVAHKGAVQLMRIDMPLKSVGKPQTVKLATLNKMGYKNISNSLLIFLAANYKICTFSVQKPYILVPYCRANAEIKLTLSEVTDWPKSHMIGHLTSHIKHYILRKRSFIANQGMNNNFTFMDIPQQEEGAKLNMIIKPDFASMMQAATNGSKSGGYAAKTMASSASMLGAVAITHKETRMDYTEGALMFSVLCMGFSEFNDYGYVEVLYQESIQSTRKKCWCVLIDRQFMVFNIVKENVKPRYSIDLRAAMVSVGSDEVIKIKSPTDTQFFHFLTLRDYEKWMRKLYVQSASHHSMAYHTYIKKRYIEHSSYTDKAPPQPSSHQTNNMSDAEELVLNTFSQAAMLGAVHRQNSFSPHQFKLKRATSSKSSMDAINLIEFEVSNFLDQMKHDFIQLKAKDLITKHETDIKKEWDKKHENHRREDMVTITHSVLNHRQDYDF